MDKIAGECSVLHLAPKAPAILMVDASGLSTSVAAVEPCSSKISASGSVLLGISKDAKSTVVPQDTPTTSPFSNSAPKASAPSLAVLLFVSSALRPMVLLIYTSSSSYFNLSERDKSEPVYAEPLILISTIPRFLPCLR